MSTDDSESGEERFETLRKCLEKPCRNMLHKILILKFKGYEDLIANDSWKNVSDVSKKAFEKFRKIKKFKFKILCDVFLSGVCDCVWGSPAIGWSSTENIPERCIGIADDILRIWRIWQENIENKEKESISDDQCNRALTLLQNIADRMKEHPEVKEIGREFLYELISVKEDGHNIFALQAGDGNRMEINCDSPIEGSVYIHVFQKGKDNVLILYIVKDDRKDKSSECVKIVLHSDNPAFQNLTKNARKLNTEEINKDPTIKDKFFIIEIKRGSLVVTVTIKNKETMEKNIQWLLRSIFERKDMAKIFMKHDVNEVKIEGYIYNPNEYCHELSRQASVFHSVKNDTLYKTEKFHFNSHLTWTFARCICDVDIFLTDLFYNLSSFDFTTEANDNIWVVAQGSVILPKTLKFSSIVHAMTDNKDETIKNINVHFAKLSCEIQSLQNAKDLVHMTFKTSHCKKYEQLLAEDGFICAVMRQLISSANIISKVQVMRIGIVIDTDLMQGRGNQKESSLEIDCRPKLSPKSETINSCAFPQILTNVLRKCENVDAEIPKRLKIEVKIKDGEGQNKMAVAIDIGTTYSGYAFAECYQLEKDPLKIQLPTWEYSSDEPDLAKIPSVILFDKDKKFVAFGIEAERKYYELAEKGQHASFYYFQGFKLLLNELANNEQLTRYAEIPDGANKMFPAVKVFSHAIRYFKDHFIQTFEQKGTFFKEDKIEWILTIPIVWTGAAKDFVIDAADDAGLPVHQVTIASEPEAATLWYKHSQKEQVSSPMETGSRTGHCNYIVLDAGGVVDITFCEDTNDGISVKTYQKDVQHGGIGVDQGFESILRDIVGDSLLERYKQKHTKDYAALFRGFEAIKKSYNEKSAANQNFSFSIPLSLENECRKRLNMDLNLLTSKTDYRNHIRWDKEQVYIYLPTFVDLFKSVCEKIVIKLQTFLKSFQVTYDSKILMVGGFSENALLKDAVKNAFQGLTVIFQENPELAIMKGALLFCPDLVLSGSWFDKLEKYPNQTKPHVHEQPIKDMGQKDVMYTQTEKERKNLVDIYNLGGINEKALVIAAIDFGTSYSGYGFILKVELQNDSAKPYIPIWQTRTGGLFSAKVPTSLLLNREKQFIAFGFEADDMYMNLKCDEEHFDYYYFPRFMTNFTGMERGENLIPDIMGKEIPAVDLLFMAIKYFHHECLNSLKQKGKELMPDEIAWTFPVPSHWKDSAKGLIQKAAINAGISSNNVFIVLDPEAALVYYNSLHKFGTESGEIKDMFHPGRKYLLLDVGGLRLDIYVYESLQNGKLLELVTRSVKNLGGVNVDEAFEAFLVELFSKNVMKEHFKKYFSDYMELFFLFEEKKRRFNYGQSKTISLCVPVSLIVECEDQLGKNLKTVINESKYRDHINVRHDKLIIDMDLFKSFFEPTCSKIIQHMQTLMASQERLELEKILMVGGFSESEMVQNAVKDAFPQCQVLSVGAGIAVLEGAIRLVGGTSFAPRISKYTFGVDSLRVFDPKIHKPMKRRNICGIDYCIDFFSIHVRIGEVLYEGKHASRMFYLPVYPNQSEIGFRLFKSKSPNPMYIDEPNCKVLGTVTISIPTSSCTERYVKCWLIFGGPEITCTVECPQTEETASMSVQSAF